MESERLCRNLIRKVRQRRHCIPANMVMQANPATNHEPEQVQLQLAESNKPEYFSYEVPGDNNEAEKVEAVPGKL